MTARHLIENFWKSARFFFLSSWFIVVDSNYQKKKEQIKKTLGFFHFSLSCYIINYFIYLFGLYLDTQSLRCNARDLQPTLSECRRTQRTCALLIAACSLFHKAHIKAIHLFFYSTQMCSFFCLCTAAILLPLPVLIQSFKRLLVTNSAFEKLNE